MTSRAAASIDSAGAPGRTAAVAAAWAALEDRERGEERLVRAAGRVAAGDPQHPGRVAAVAAERAADVEHDRLAGRDHPLARPRDAGDAEFGPGADDREVGRVVALGDEALADLPG